jgi:hypothetical protein
LRGTITTRRFASWPLVMAVLAASACGEGPLPEVNNEPPEVAQLRAAGKSPREIRNELRALELKKALKGAPVSARRTH